MTLADLLALPGMHQRPHPQAPGVVLHVLAERHPSGTAIIFVAYAEVEGEDESRVAELTGLPADCGIDMAVELLENLRGPASRWPTLTASLQRDGQE